MSQYDWLTIYTPFYTNYNKYTHVYKTYTKYQAPGPAGRPVPPRGIVNISRIHVVYKIVLNLIETYSICIGTSIVQKLPVGGILRHVGKLFKKQRRSFEKMWWSEISDRGQKCLTKTEQIESG